MEDRMDQIDRSDMHRRRGSFARGRSDQWGGEGRHGEGRREKPWGFGHHHTPQRGYRHPKFFQKRKGKKRRRDRERERKQNPGPGPQRASPRYQAQQAPPAPPPQQSYTRHQRSYQPQLWTPYGTGNPHGNPHGNQHGNPHGNQHGNPRPDTRGEQPPREEGTWKWIQPHPTRGRGRGRGRGGRGRGRPNNHNNHSRPPFDKWRKPPPKKRGYPGQAPFKRYHRHHDRRRAYQGIESSQLDDLEQTSTKSDQTPQSPPEPESPRSPRHLCQTPTSVTGVHTPSLSVKASPMPFDTFDGQRVFDEGSAYDTEYYRGGAGVDPYKSYFSDQSTKGKGYAPAYTPSDVETWEGREEDYSRLDYAPRVDPREEIEELFDTHLSGVERRDHASVATLRLPHRHYSTA